MKKILLLIGLLGIVLVNVFSQTELERDIVRATDELYIRGDTTIIELIEEHTSSTSVGAENGLTKSGSNIGLRGTLNQSTSVAGAGYEMFLGTGGSKTGAHNINTSGAFTVNSDGNQVFNVNGNSYTWNGTYWISSSSDTLADLAAVSVLIAASIPAVPLNMTYTLSSSTADAKPGGGLFRLNHATPASVTWIYIDDFDSDAYDKSDFIELADTGSYFYIQDASDNSNYYIYQTNGYISATGYTKYGVAYMSGSGSVPFSTCENILIVNNTTGSGTPSDSTALAYSADTFNINIAARHKLYGDATSVTLLSGTGGINFTENSNVWSLHNNLWSRAGDTLVRTSDLAVLDQTTIDGADTLQMAVYPKGNADTTGWVYLVPGASDSSWVSITVDTTKTNYLLNNTSSDLNIQADNDIILDADSTAITGDLSVGDILYTDLITGGSGGLIYLDDESSDEIVKINSDEFWVGKSSTLIRTVIDEDTGDHLIELEVPSGTGTQYIKILGNDGTGVIMDNDNFAIIDYSGADDTIAVFKESEIEFTSPLSIGGSSSVDSIMELNDALASEVLDSINIGGKVIRYNASEGVHEFETAKSDVVIQNGLEHIIPVFNNTGALIPNGKPVSYNGVVGDSIAAIILASASVDSLAERYAGITTMDIPDNDWGYIALYGYVRYMNTTGLSGLIYLGDSVLRDSIPAYPSRIVITGVLISDGTTDGILYAYPSQAFDYNYTTRDYSFNSYSIGAGTYYVAGHYNWNTTSSTLTDLTSVNYGTANSAHSSHAGIVASGAGTATGGVAGLRVTGTSINDAGVRTASDADTIVWDITAASTDEYFEAKKFIGQVAFEVITISGTISASSFTFNYGFSKYEDIENQSFYISGVEVTGLASANDASFNFEVLHHNGSWTYAATGFEAGDDVLVSWTDVLAPEDDLVSGEDFAFKRTGINYYIDGNEVEGLLFRITTGSASSVGHMDIHLGVAIE